MLQELYAEAKEKNTYIAGKCVVYQWCATLSESDQAAFNSSMDDEDFSTRSLFTMYKNAGATFGITSLKGHRNGDCSCR